MTPLAARRATSTIPIVMAAAGDPVGSGLVAQLPRPGGNITGTSLMAPDLGGKRLELIKELLPEISRTAVLWNAACTAPGSAAGCRPAAADQRHPHPGDGVRQPRAAAGQPGILYL
ncbi:MAG: hypothetical protein JOY83_26185, partial [Alphaproteobacteria bacterium]|nr:hypothetical protein [Alphaproteobacteria bacterium]